MVATCSEEDASNFRTLLVKSTIVYPEFAENVLSHMGFCILLVGPATKGVFSDFPVPGRLCRDKTSKVCSTEQIEREREGEGTHLNMIEATHTHR